MATKLQFYSELAERSTKKLTNSRENWTEYLTAAARLYKYPFEEQIMIYAQRPNATACAPLETWNNPMNRYVKRGSKGIALIYQEGGKSKIKYVFDYADTEDGWRNPKRPFIWELKKEHETVVMDALVKTYGDMEGTLADMIYNIAYELAQDYYDNNAHDIGYCIKDSFLEDYDKDSIKVAFREAITVSTAYSIMSRCGLNPDEYFEDEDFSCIFDFNSLGTVNVLGAAVSELSEQVLREIELTIKKHERNKTAERSTEYDKLGVHQEWGLYASESGTERADRGTDWEIRFDEVKPSQESQEDTLQLHGSKRGISPSPVGNRPDGQPEAGSVNERIDGTESAAGQSNRSDGMGSAYEQSESASGGIYTERTDFQLEKTAEAADDTASFYLSVVEGLHQEWDRLLFADILRDEAVLTSALNSSNENTIKEIENAVRRLFGTVYSEMAESKEIQGKDKDWMLNEVNEYFFNDRTPPLVQQLYNHVINSDEYKGRIEDNTPKSIFIEDDNIINSMDLSAYRDGDTIGYNAKGVKFEVSRIGDYTFTTTKITSWGDIQGAEDIPADIIRQIRAANGYETAEQAVSEHAAEENTFNADQKQSSDIPDKQKYKYYSVIRPIEIGTYPKEVRPDDIVNFDRRQTVEDGLFEAWGYLIYPQPLTESQILDYELKSAPGNPDIQGEKNGSQIGVNLSETLEQSAISLDTVDAMLRDGGNKNNSVLRIAAHYMKGKTSAENTEFLKREYGRGSKGLRIDNQRFASWFDENGIIISEGPAALNAMRTVHLSWEQIESRIFELLHTGQYLQQNELDAVPGFERKELADKLWYLHQDTENNIEFFIDDNLFRGGFPDSTERIAKLLSQPEQLNNIIDRLRAYCTAYEQDPSILQYKRLHNPQELIQRLSDLRITPVAFTANEIPNISRIPFVTEEDINAVLTRGSNVSEGKYRIYSFFLNEHTSKEKADFLKDEYGTGGGTHAIYRADNSYENHDSKGLEILRGSLLNPADRVLIPWNRAARLIDDLINNGQYMTRTEIDRLPEYEKNIIAHEISSFYYNLPQDIIRPFTTNFSFLNDEEIKTIRKMLDDSEQVDAILESMRPIWEVTLPEDKYYNARQKAYKDLTDYRNGTFNLFPQLSAVEMPNKPEDNITAPRSDFMGTQTSKQIEQLSLFTLPSVEEQQAIISRAENAQSLNKQESPIVSIPVIDQYDIDSAIRNWNGNLESKMLVYEYMYESSQARARATANLLWQSLKKVKGNKKQQTPSKNVVK